MHANPCRFVFPGDRKVPGPCILRNGGRRGWVGRRRLRAARSRCGSTPAVELGAVKLSRHQAVTLSCQARQPKVEMTPSWVKL